MEYMENRVSTGKRKFGPMNRDDVSNLMNVGFNMLVGSEKPSQSSDARTEAPSQVVMLPLVEILGDHTFQYRLTTAVGSLAQDIQMRGQTTPIFVRPYDGKYQLISGFRRFAATKELGREKILARVFVDLNDYESTGLAISENLQREDFSDLEKAQVTQRMRDLGLSVQEIGTAINRSVRTVQQYLSVLEAPTIVQTALHEAKISLSMAFELARENVDPKNLGEILKSIEEDNLSVRSLKRLLTRTIVSKSLVNPTPRSRAGFQPVRLISKNEADFDLTVKFRRSRISDIDTIISTLRTALAEVEQIGKDIALQSRQIEK
jgi:ParB/RepB/Spo0J family partition protein